jgi:hypothetical protein
MSLGWIGASFGLVYLGVKAFGPDGVPIDGIHYIEGIPAYLLGTIFFVVGLVFFGIGILVVLREFMGIRYF